MHPHLVDIVIPDVDVKKVSLIIGEDVKGAHVVREVRSSEDPTCELYATRTALGWTIAGRMDEDQEVYQRAREVSVNFLSNDQTLNKQVEEFWKLETSGLNDRHAEMSVEDYRAEEILQRTTKLVYGHYETSLLWRQDDPKLPTNKIVAETRLHGLKRKFGRDPEYETIYRKSMEDFIHKGHARKLTKEQSAKITAKTWYLPHHGVVNPNKPGKVRVVFDAAAEYRGTSLNKNLLQGPDYTNNLIGVLIRFRQDNIALVADIEGMFLQVKVPQEDQEALRFLWWEKGSDDSPVEYAMSVHIFGATDSPCCANYSLRRTAEDNRNEFDDCVVETVLRNFYVDDMLKALRNEALAIHVAKELMLLLAKGGFRLTKFMSNNREVLKTVQCEKRGVPTLDLDLDQLPVQRALGVKWDMEKDTFSFNAIDLNKADTMRGVLSCVSSFYDPQGFAAPVLLQARHILQECWRRKMTWDTPLEGALLEGWNQWKLALPLMEEFEIPRCFFSQTDHDDCIVQLHHFCDASEIGYGSVSYLRIEYPDGHVECALIMGKSRNCPIRAPTIPRLELQSAVLSVRVDKLVKKELDVSLERTFFWTDSQITLFCINNESKRFQTYVANRLNEIREYTQPEQWRHCPGTLNPADDCSRGLDAQGFLECERWKRGPDFLWMKEDMWPRNRVEEIPDNNLEIKKEKTTYSTDLRPQPQSLVDELLGRYSKWKNLLRAVAWLIKFSNWLRQGRQIQNKNLTVNDLKQAKQRIVSFVQRATFSDEIDELTKRKPNGSITKRPSVKTSSTIVKLRPMINPEDGLLRVSGRIAEAPITFDAKHQMILPQNSHVTTLIIRHFHQQLGHCGQEHLLSRLREEFWVVRARASIKKVIGRCFQCKRQLAQRMEQVMADLPKVRLTPYEPPFTNTGLDYFGPLLVKQRRSTVKRYGCIFTCMSSRAIHLELAVSLETDDFILVLRRFLNTRGNVRQLRSDNGTNFVGAERELREAIEKWNLLQIEGELHQRECEWIFHPPNAPHMSGVWERLIRSVKRAMKAIIGEALVGEEVLRTVFSEVQGIVNSRPLCPNSDDPKDMEPLTPNHFLLQKPNIALPPGYFEKNEIYSRKKWRQTQVLANHYWQRWLREYVPTLQERQKWVQSRRNLSVNDLVLIVSEGQPRGRWLLGRVIKVFPGSDGMVRSAEVKTKTSILHRPVAKLCLLEES